MLHRHHCFDQDIDFLDAVGTANQILQILQEFFLFCSYQGRFHGLTAPFLWSVAKTKFPKIANDRAGFPYWSREYGKARNFRKETEVLRPMHA
jgi:hypothetical protein